MPLRWLFDTKYTHLGEFDDGFCATLDTQTMDEKDEQEGAT